MSNGNRRTNRQRISMWLAVALAALILLPMLIAGIVSLMPQASGAAVSQSDVNKQKDKLSDLSKQKKDIQAEINAIKKDRTKIVEQKQALDKQIEIISEQIEAANELINQMTLAIAERQAALDEARVKEAEQLELFRARVCAMEKMGEVSYLSVLLQAQSFSDLLTRWDSIQEITRYDRQLMDDLRATREQIERDKTLLEADKLEQYELRKELALNQAELAEQYTEVDSLINSLAADQINAQKAYEQAEKDMDATQAEINKMMAEIKRQQELAQKNTPYVGGAYLWPVPGYEGKISSKFSPSRVHPILGYARPHNGIDIPAPKGTKIVAANAGTVIIRQNNSGYGNYIVIDHGGGQATLYGHMSSFAGFKVGNTVSRGDVIGYVGSTGLSTGNHLHFEISIDGKPTDPEPLLKGK